MSAAAPAPILKEIKPLPGAFMLLLRLASISSYRRAQKEGTRRISSLTFQWL
jgi:hypothetical protein